VFLDFIMIKDKNITSKNKTIPSIIYLHPLLITVHKKTIFKSKSKEIYSQEITLMKFEKKARK
jgi:hypothetical protein